MPKNVKVTVDRVAAVLKNLNALTISKVYAGIPASKTTRQETEGQPINNATLMYIHENGAPEVGIPARPVVVPAINSIRDDVVNEMRKGAQAALGGSKSAIDTMNNRIGLMAQNAMRKRITDGPFIPLKEKTLAARRSRGRTGTKPLIDTGQLRRALTYVIRTKGSS